MDFIKIIDGIEVCDNAFEEKLINEFYCKIKNSSFYFSGSSYSSAKEPKFWFLPIIDKDINWVNSDFEKEIKYFQESLNKEFKRFYINGQTFTQSGEFHEDDGDLTYLLYPDISWNIDRGGGTEFKILNNDVTLVVYPKFNRLLRFNSKIEHRALPNIDLNGLRISVAFKTLKEN